MLKNESAILQRLTIFYVFFVSIIISSLPKLILSSVDLENDLERQQHNTLRCPSYVNDRIQRCVMPVADYARVLNQQKNSSITPGFGETIQLPKFGRQVFKELCRLIHNFETCLEGYREKCPKHITISLIGASYGFLCNEGYDTFMNSAECLADLDQKPSVKRCHNETIHNIEKVNHQLDTSVHTKLTKMCSSLNSFSGCVMNPIRRHCGVAAWEVIFRVLRDTTLTLIPGCNFGNNSNRNNKDLNSPILSNFVPSNNKNPEENEQLNSQQQRHHHHHRKQTQRLSTPTVKDGVGTNDPANLRSSSFSQPQQQQQQKYIGEGRLSEIQVEVSEGHPQAYSSDDDFYTLNRRKYSRNGELGSNRATNLNNNNRVFITFILQILFLITFIHFYVTC